MCGIAGILSPAGESVAGIRRKLNLASKLISHRGPDDKGTWVHERSHVGFAFRRLSIIDLQTGHQPMKGRDGSWVVFNGEIYNYRELRSELGEASFRTTSDTEVILRAYEKWGEECVDHFRGMFAFAIWNEKAQALFCARDRFGIKPFYYMQHGGVFYFGSEVKAILPFAPDIQTNPEGLKDYLTFQFCLQGKTLFNDVYELLPGHTLRIRNGSVVTRRYWEVYYNLDWDHPPEYFEERLDQLLEESIRFHVRSDVEIGSYISGGIDSSIVALLGARHAEGSLAGFHGKFTYGSGYDESTYARKVAANGGFPLHEVDITADDFISNISDVIYHLDYPVAGPGSFPQYMVSQLAAKHRKVVLGGQGGDEVFGGYTRYLIAYFEQCIKSAIDGTVNNGNFIVTYESIIPNLSSLRTYKPMLREFWKEGLFDPMDQRYFQLINRAGSLGNEINWDALGSYSPFESFKSIFNGSNVGKESYFDQMTHFDFKTLLPALLQVEDRVSMAHGLESRVPILDHPLVEFAATAPSNVKFKNGTLKQLFVRASGKRLPAEVLDRKDKMGFPTPLNEWIAKDAKSFVQDVFASRRAAERGFVDVDKVRNRLSTESKFGRALWGFLSLELWHQAFHDKASEWKNMKASEEAA